MVEVTTVGSTIITPDGSSVMLLAEVVLVKVDHIGVVVRVRVAICSQRPLLGFIVTPIMLPDHPVKRLG